MNERRAAAPPPSDRLAPGESLGRSLGLSTAANLRDVGGYAATDGRRVRRGLAYRSDLFRPLTEADRAKLAALGLTHRYDLRTAAEIAAWPDQMPADVRPVHLDVLADAGSSAAEKLGELVRDPRRATSDLGNGRIEALFVETYRKLVASPAAQRAYRDLLLALSDAERLPAVFHCTTGKDRTGWAAASLLSLLDVPRETIFEDYLRTNDHLLPFHAQRIDGFAAAGGDRAILVAIFGVRREYLAAAFDEAERLHGSIEGYLERGLGIDPHRRRTLRELFLVA